MGGSCGIPKVPPSYRCFLSQGWHQEEFKGGDHGGGNFEAADYLRDDSEVGNPESHHKTGDPVSPKDAHSHSNPVSPKDASSHSNPVSPKNASSHSNPISPKCRPKSIAQVLPIDLTHPSNGRLDENGQNQRRKKKCVSCCCQFF